MWPIGFSWTKGCLVKITNPDNSISEVNVHAGPFFYLPFNFLKRFKVEFYIGFRPTPIWDVGYNNEGDGKFFTKLRQWLKKKGWGNLGFAFRVKKKYG